MEKDEILIHGVRFSHDQVQMIMLVILGLSGKQITDFMGGDINDTKKQLMAIRLKLDCDSSPQLTYRALTGGFDPYCNLYGKPIFTEREQKRLIVIAPRVLFSKPEPALV